MSWLLRDFDLLSTLLRALTLGLEALVLGGIAFLLFVAAPLADQARARICRTASNAAYAFAGAQAASTGLSVVILVAGSGLPLASVMSAGFLIAGAASVACALLIAVSLRVLSIGAVLERTTLWLATPAAFTLLAAAVAMSHAASRMANRSLLAGLTAAHHLGMAGWVGTMAFLLLALRQPELPSDTAVLLARRYSTLAMISVVMLVGGGIGLAYFYIGSGSRFWIGLYGTSYGLLVMVKTYLVLVMLMLGATNQALLRAPGKPGSGLMLRLRRFSEAEIGLGFTAVLAAASLTSQAPAVDLPAGDRLSGQEIVERLRWEAPRLSSPPITALAPPVTLEAGLPQQQFGIGTENDANDRAWSEYNHHWAGLIVLAAGSLALVHRALAARAARIDPGRNDLGWRERCLQACSSLAQNWPLLFLVLALFILLRADPENWPLGPRPFWASFSRPDVLEHRLYALLISAFAFFEWAVERGRLRWPGAAYVFPLVCAAGGGGLLTHAHALGSMHEEMLAELSHTPIAVMGATAGWGRWLELRLPGSRPARIASCVWPVCLMLVGLILLDYREA